MAQSPPEGPGAGSGSLSRRQALDLLRRFESPDTTWMPGGEEWPVVWERARGMEVVDSEGRRYLDFTAAFGVAAAGHAPPQVVRAGQEQMEALLHAMGDVHPHRQKALLLERLSDLTYGRWQAGGSGRGILCSTGSEAVEAALKSACRLTGRTGVLAFRDAYHGLGYGSLVPNSWGRFRRRFEGQLASFAEIVPFPGEGERLEDLERRIAPLLAGGRIGCVLAEPIQGRGGMRVPPEGFLELLRGLCDRHGACLVLDEIYTGFGRAGGWFACELEGVAPDFLCVGKSLAGGFPISACVGRAGLMEAAWPKERPEAIHTSTFLGHPVGCAMALANLRLIEEEGLVERSRRSGAELARLLEEALGGRARVRGRGLMLGADFGKEGRAAELARELLSHGFLALPCGRRGQVLALTPPLIVGRSQMESLAACLGRLAGGSPRR